MIDTIDTGQLNQTQSAFSWRVYKKSGRIAYHWIKCEFMKFRFHVINKCTNHDDVMEWKHFLSWWRHENIFRVTGGFVSERPVTRSFDVFFDLRLNKRLSKQPGSRWFETLSRSLWRLSYALLAPLRGQFPSHVYDIWFCVGLNKLRNNTASWHFRNLLLYYRIYMPIVSMVIPVTSGRNVNRIHTTYIYMICATETNAQHRRSKRT